MLCGHDQEKNCYVITWPSCQVRSIYPSKNLCTFLLFPSFDECSLIMSSLSILNKSSLEFFFSLPFFFRALVRRRSCFCLSSGGPYDGRKGSSLCRYRLTFPSYIIRGENFVLVFYLCVYFFTCFVFRNSERGKGRDIAEVVVCLQETDQRLTNWSV